MTAVATIFGGMKGDVMLHTMTSRVVSPDDGLCQVSLVSQAWGKLMCLVVNLRRDHHEQSQLSGYKAKHMNKCSSCFRSKLGHRCLPYSNNKAAAACLFRNPMSTRGRTGMT
jgi:ribosomal protein L32